MTSSPHSSALPQRPSRFCTLVCCALTFLASFPDALLLQVLDTSFTPPETSALVEEQNDLPDEDNMIHTSPGTEKRPSGRKSCPELASFSPHGHPLPHN